MTSNHIIRVSGLTKRFGDIVAVDNLDLNVLKGDIYGFLGPNGSGKSTTIRMILSLVFPDSGEISLFGKSLHKNKMEILSRIGALVEKPDFYEYLSAFRNLEILMRYSRLQKSSKRIHEVLEMVGLLNRAHSKVRTYSKGMKQRLGIAQALLNDPDLIILDEPGSGLDPAGIRDVRKLVHDLRNEHGKTILLSSHQLFEVEQIANRMIIISKGKKVIEGRVDELLEQMEQNVIIEVSDLEKAVGMFKSSDLIKGEPEVLQGNRILIRIPKDTIPLVVKQLSGIEAGVVSIQRTQNLEELFINLV